MNESWRLMNGKRQSLYTIYIMLACVFLTVCKFEEGIISLDMPSFPKKHCCLFTT